MMFFICDSGGIAAFSAFDRLILRLSIGLDCWIKSLRAAYRLHVAPLTDHLPTRWLARALNGRRVSGACCNGELGTPAVRSLVG